MFVLHHILHTKAILRTAVSLLVLSLQSLHLFLGVERFLVWRGAKPIYKGLTSVGCSG